MTNFAKNLALWIVIGLLIVAVFNLFQTSSSRGPQSTLAFSDFLNDVNRGQVADVTIRGNNISGHFTDSRAFTTYAPNDPNLVTRLTEKNVRITAAPVDENVASLFGVLIFWLPTLLLIGLLLSLDRWRRREINDLNRRIGLLEGGSTGQRARSMEVDRDDPDLPSLENLQSGTVDVYCFQEATETFIPPVLHNLYTEYPNLSFNITMSNTAETIQALTTSTAEIGLLVNPPPRDNISTIEIFRDTIVAAVAPNHPLAGCGTASLKKIAEFPLALIQLSVALRREIERVFDHSAINPNVFCVTNSLSLLKRIARSDGQCTLFPRFAVEDEVATGSLCTVTIEEFVEVPRVYCICTLNSRALSPAAKVFADAIVDFCRRYSH